MQIYLTRFFIGNLINWPFQISSLQRPWSQVFNQGCGHLRSKKIFLETQSGSSKKSSKIHFWDKLDLSCNFLLYAICESHFKAENLLHFFSLLQLKIRHFSLFIFYFLWKVMKRYPKSSTKMFSVLWSTRMTWRWLL